MGRLMFGHLSIILVLMLSTQVGAMGKRHGPATITGTIRLVGNEPFARVVLTTAGSGKSTGEHDYLLIGPLQKELRELYQGRMVTLEGNPCASPTPQFSRCFEPAKIVGAEGKTRE